MSFSNFVNKDDLFVFVRRLMIITQKVTYLAFSVHDGKRNLTYLEDLEYLPFCQNLWKFRLKVP